MAKLKWIELDPTSPIALTRPWMLSLAVWFAVSKRRRRIGSTSMAMRWLTNFTVLTTFAERVRAMFIICSAVFTSGERMNASLKRCTYAQALIWRFTMGSLHVLFTQSSGLDQLDHIVLVCQVKLGHCALQHFLRCVPVRSK